MKFIDRLIKGIKEKSNCVLVGLDPNIDLIPDSFKNRFDPNQYENYYHYLGEIFWEYNKLVLDVMASKVAMIKPQIAFYEVAGHYGLMSLRKTIEYAKLKGLLVLLDAKRNDIPSTTEAYSKSYLSNVNANTKPYLDVDCITTTPFLGFDSLEPYLKACIENEKGLFICLKTSNPGSSDLQDMKLANGEIVYCNLAKRISGLAQDHMGVNGYSSIGVVVGVTYPEAAKKIRKVLSDCYFLVPGFGIQGEGEGLGNFFNHDGLGAVINVSRSLIYKNIDQNNIEESLENNLLEVTSRVDHAISPGPDSVE